MLRVSTVMTGHPGAPYFSTMYFNGVLDSEAIDAQSAVHDFWGGLVGFIAGGLAMQVQPDVEQIDPVTGFILDVHSNAVAVVNSTGNAPLPFATQGLLRWRTGQFVAGKEIRGRTFIPNLANDAQLSALPSTAFTTAANAAATGLLTDPGPANEFGVWSRKNGQFAQASNGTLWSNFAVLRSRRD